jgi:hypothetical protein
MVFSGSLAKLFAKRGVAHPALHLNSFDEELVEFLFADVAPVFSRGTGSVT